MFRVTKSIKLANIMKDLILSAIRESAKSTKEPHFSKEISETDAYFLIVDFLNTISEGIEEKVEINGEFIRDLISAGQQIIKEQDYENNFK